MDRMFTRNGTRKASESGSEPPMWARIFLLVCINRRESENGSMSKRERLWQQIADLGSHMNPAIPLAVMALFAQMDICPLKANRKERREWVNSNEELFLSFVEAMVPIRIYDIRRTQGWVSDADIAWARAQVDIIASGGDAVLCYVRGQSGKSMGVLCKCLAILAFCPGGITFCGLHFEVKEEE